MGSVERSRKVENPKARRSTQKLPKRISEMSKEALEKTLQKKRECNAKALQIVESFLENTVSEAWFLDCLKFINPSHYQDVIEERAISLNCGYPLCQKKLKNIPSQQYHISTKMNKVYDITERKNFCSNQCYKASAYVKAQLLTSPLWIRDKEEIPKFNILHFESASGGIGEEIDVGQNNALKEELKQLNEEEPSNRFTSVLQFTRDSLSQLVSDIEKKDKKRNSGTENCTSKKEEDKNKAEVKDKFNSVKRGCKETNSAEQLEFQDGTVENVDTDKAEQTKKTYDTTDRQNVQNSQKGNRTEHPDKSTEKRCEISNNFRYVACESSTIHTVNENEPYDILSNSPKSVCSKIQKSIPKKRESNKKSLNIPSMTNAVIYIEKCLYDWFTIESMCFLFGEEKLKEMVQEKGDCIKEYYKGTHNASWDSKTQEQYLAICRRLNILEIADQEYDHQILTKPLPDYTAVREEAKKMDLKVRAYYQGKTVYEDVDSISISETDSDSAPVLPLVDLHAQNSLRRRIVLDRLNRILPDLLRTFGLSSRDISGDVRSLVTTFTLGANNITFKPPEWSLIGLIIIKMLSIKDMRLQILLDNKQVIKYTTMMLMSFQQDGGYLDRLLAWLTDIDSLLRKQ